MLSFENKAVGQPPMLAQKGGEVHAEVELRGHVIPTIQCLECLGGMTRIPKITISECRGAHEKNI